MNISFVVPAFNCANTIRESIDSIFLGNFEDGDEVIIVNDGSTDQTENIIGKLKNTYANIVYLKNETNKGCPATRNIGISIAKNPLIFNLDSDNVLVKGSIGKLKEFLITNNADIAAFSEYHYFQKTTKEITHKWVYRKDTMTLADFLTGLINPGPGGNFLYTKASWERIHGYWEYGKGLHEAWGFTLKQLSQGAKFVVVPNSYYFHRYGHDSLFVTESKKENESTTMAIKMITNCFDLLNDEDVEYIKNDPAWFEKLSTRPIRLKSGETGYTGHYVGQRNYSVFKNIKSLIDIFLNKLYLRYSFVADFRRYKKLAINDKRFSLFWKNRNPQLQDKTSATSFDTHYIYHPAWAVRIVKAINPEFHVDVSSTLAFSATLSAFIPVRFYDYRPANIILSGLESKQADLMSLPFPSNSVTSLSCMHTVEHIGLGRYGDPIDPMADIKAINELKRVTAHGGSLLFVVPVGKPKILFNAHRIYSYDQIISYFDGFELKDFSLVPDNAGDVGMILNASKEQVDDQNFGCGCFWFIKL